MTDKERFLDALRDAGPEGIHSHEVRRRAISGHPSERAKELEREGHAIRREPEFIRNRPGVRFVLEDE